MAALLQVKKPVASVVVNQAAANAVRAVTSPAVAAPVAVAPPASTPKTILTFGPKKGSAEPLSSTSDTLAETAADTSGVGSYADPDDGSSASASGDDAVPVAAATVAPAGMTPGTSTLLTVAAVGVGAAVLAHLLLR